jgi:1-acyl-sn-glycerol-3-phosphate acyltransferase
MALPAYYRELRVVGREHVPASGPLLLIGNHNNALIDPIMAGIALDRRVDFVGKSTIGKMKGLGWLAKKLGVIFVHRGQDVAKGADPRRNVAALDALVSRLEAGHAVCIFPEGKSHDEPALARFKSGSARAALSFLEQNPEQDLSVLPFGLQFEAPRVWRSRAMMRFGAPISLRGWLAEHPDADHRALTRSLQASVASLTLNYEDPRDKVLLTGLADLLRSNELEWRMGPKQETHNALVARLIDGKGRLSIDESALVEPLRHRALLYQEALDALRVDVETVFTPAGPGPMLRFVLREGLFALLGLPLAIWGAVQHALPWAMTRIMTTTFKGHPAETATRAILAALLIFPPILGLQSLWVAYRFSPILALAYALSLPPLGAFALAYADRVGDAVWRASAYLRLTKRPQERGRLLAEGRALVQRLQEIERSLNKESVEEVHAETSQATGNASDWSRISSSMHAGG